MQDDKQAYDHSQLYGILAEPNSLGNFRSTLVVMTLAFLKAALQAV